MGHSSHSHRRLPFELPAPRQIEFGAFEKRFYASPPRCEADLRWALDDLLSFVSTSGRPWLSLDVFDTLLLRNAKSERRRFREISANWAAAMDGGLRSPSVSDIYQARLRAAEICYSCGPIVAQTQEGAFENIVEVTLHLLGCGAEYRDSLVCAELEYELRNTEPFLLISELAAAHKERGGRVLLLSDMYMSADHIGRLLHKHGLVGVYDQLISSADLTVNKRSGTIFTVVQESLGFSADEVIHIGDSFHSDFYRPRAAGWLAKHLPIPKSEEDLRLADAAEFDQSIATPEDAARA